MQSYRVKFKIIFFTIIFLGLFGWAGSSEAAKNITLPYEQKFDTNAYTSQEVWISEGATHTWQSGGCWSGGCAKFTPPYGPNQGYSGLGQYTNLSGTQLNVRFLLLHGPTFREYAPPGTANKLVVLNRGTLLRPMLIYRTYSDSSWTSNPYMTIGPCDGTTCKYYGGDFWPDGTDTYRIGNAPDHRELEWVSIEIEANAITGIIKLYIYTQDGELAGLYQTQTMTPGETWSYVDIIGGFWNSGGVQNADNYFMIDELKISNSYIGPPAGFLAGGGGDTTNPSIPANLTAIAVSSSQINLSWTASTDNVGVTGYRIYRGGNQIATSITANYSDTGLSPSTAYTYTVSAYDAAGNNSLQSASATTTSLPPPGGGVIFQDGFESGNFNAWGYGQGLTVSNSDHHSGQYAARGVSTQGATTDLYREKAFGDHPNAGGPAIEGGVYFKFAHKYDAGFNLGTQQNYNKIFLMNFEDPSNVRRDQVVFETNVNSGYASRGEYMFELTHWTASGGWLTGSLRLQNRNGSPLLYREGQWDVIKVYLQPNTPNQNNGILRMWVNGVLKAEHTDVNIRFEPYNLNLAILSSYMTVTDVSGTRWWDDVIISQTDPDSGADTTPPAAPTGLSVQ